MHIYIHIHTHAHTPLQGEKALKSVFPNATIVRPARLFGPEDRLLNWFAQSASSFGVIPLFNGGDALLQPTYVSDVVDAMVKIIEVRLSLHTHTHTYTHTHKTQNPFSLLLPPAPPPKSTHMHTYIHTHTHTHTHRTQKSTTGRPLSLQQMPTSPGEN